MKILIKKEYFYAGCRSLISRRSSSYRFRIFLYSVSAKLSAAAQLLFYPQKLVVFRHTVRPGGRPSLDLSRIQSHCNVCNRRILRLTRTVADNGTPAIIFRHAYGLHGLRQRPDLIRLDQNRISRVHIDALLDPLRIGNKEIVSHKLDPVPQSLRQLLPARPVLLGKTILNGINRIFVTQPGPEIDHLPLKASPTVLKKEFPFSILITAVLALLCTGLSFGGLFDGTGSFHLNRIDGLALLVLFLVFLVSQVRGALKARTDESGEDYETMSPLKSVLLVLVGLAGIILGGDLVVDSACEIALQYGLSQSFIGLTIVAMGTSLPELVTSMVAAQKGENDLALGNVVGSNIFNILLILGMSAAISPITVDGEAIFDMLLLIVMSGIAYVFTRSKGVLSKKEGFVFLLMYAIYFVYIYLR